MGFRSVSSAGVTGTGIITIPKPAGLGTGDQLVCGICATLSGSGIRIQSDAPFSWDGPGAAFGSGTGQPMFFGVRVVQDASKEPSSYNFLIQKLLGTAWANETNDKLGILAAYDSVVPVCGTTRQEIQTTTTVGPTTKTATLGAVVGGNPAFPMIIPTFQQVYQANAAGSTITPDAGLTERARVTNPNALLTFIMLDETTASNDAPARSGSFQTVGAQQTYAAMERYYAGAIPGALGNLGFPGGPPPSWAQDHWSSH